MADNPHKRKRDDDPRRALSTFYGGDHQQLTRILGASSEHPEATASETTGWGEFFPDDQNPQSHLSHLSSPPPTTPYHESHQQQPPQYSYGVIKKDIIDSVPPAKKQRPNGPPILREELQVTPIGNMLEPPPMKMPRAAPDLKAKLANHQFISECKEIDHRLKDMRTKIAQNELRDVPGDLSLIRDLLDDLIAQLSTLEKGFFLEPGEFKELQTVQETIQNYLYPQLNLYDMDLGALNSASDQRYREAPVFLGVTQDKAGPIFKEKQCGSFQLRLLTSARVQHITTGHVHPELVEINQRIKRNNQELENSKQVFNETGFAQFTDLKFSSGTFPNLVKMKFRVQVQVVVDSITLNKTLESNVSKPFISMTNTGSQWKDAAGMWLKEDAFKEDFEISIFCFWNYFQKHYLAATKQDVANIKRPLYLSDFEYLLKAKFRQGVLEKKTISQKEYQKFWEWIGPGLKKIRYQKYLLWLFENCYLCAFVTGAEAEDTLKMETVGAFIIRLSERLDGEFVISYKHTTGVRHYLIQPNDTADKKKTLIDFLGQSQSFVCIMQVKMDESGKKIFIKHNKNKVLQKYYKKPPRQKARNQSLGGNPYDEIIMSNNDDV
eukprot:TRINITY_DN7514_c0_g1_i1.p1 TRINITY_DN7514_c0_g1~~TRINITY_DN7514_c0_g1_i1.p1  ORF type:complete len:607 (-),score=88.70 TRINITY_DN7514_c0_g1_i1:95-1915(-)